MNFDNVVVVDVLHRSCVLKLHKFPVFLCFFRGVATETEVANSNDKGERF
jgi:hypothetical protein